MKHIRNPGTDENGYTPEDRQQLRAQYVMTTAVAVALSLSSFSVVLALFQLFGK